jgi:hypothetical protein
MIAPMARPLPSLDAGFLALLPAIHRYVQLRFRHLRPAAREEAVAEAVAAAFLAYRRLVQLGRQDLIYATPLARFAVLHVRNGRHVGGRQSSRDVLSGATQARRGFRVESIDRCDHRDGTWVAAIVVEDRRATPAQVAAARLDTSAWLGTLSRRNQRLAKVLAAGESTNQAAAQFGLTAGRVSQLRESLRRSWERFQGEAEQGDTLCRKSTCRAELARMAS